MSGRRRGQPNRGGGRFNKPRGSGRGRGGGGGGGGKATSSVWDDGDDFSRGLPKSLISQTPRPRTLDEYRPRLRPEVTGNMPMQKIFMTSENQEQVKELLRELQTQDYDDEPYEEEEDYEEEEEEEEYDELDYRDEGQFWTTHDDPVESTESPVCDPDSEEDRRPSPQPVIGLFAIGKLCRCLYGFDRERSRQALETGVGEVGATLEQLLLQVFSERYRPEAISPGGLQGAPMDECLTQRQEEALALTAIYGDRFTERIANSVWTVTLDPDFLAGIAGRNRKADAPTNGPVHIRDVCRFYLKGAGCRFGAKCKYKHQMPTEENASGPREPVGASQPGFSSYSSPEYEMEVRFPKGNRYPFQAPIVAFSTNDEAIGAAARLSVTEHLFGEALAAAKEGEPVVYTLITCCEDEATMKELLSVTHHKYSSPPPVIVAPPPIAMSKSRGGRSNASREETKPLQATEDLEDDEDEEEEEDVVVPETESYVNLRKKMVKRHEERTDARQQENEKLCRERFASMLQQRQKLPAWHEKENILDLLDTCQVLVVSGMTGCGKTTQIPQFILDASLTGPAEQVANIICTQPRRISAITVAERVAQERAERLGNSVGYQIRLETVRSAATRLLYCTTGVLLRRLEGEADLAGISHVIVDEVHERTEESDFLLLVLKDLMAQRPDLKIILMSATLNADLFSHYFHNCNTIHIPGRTFPVDQFFLEDAIAKTRYVIEDGSPFMRSGGGKDKSSWGGRGAAKEPVDQLGDDMWSFMNLQKKDFVKDSIPDQQLGLQELTVRYKGEMSVLKTIAAMDLDKINMDLVENLLEYIVDGNHGYPPGAVLVFMPGLAEIKALYEQLQSNRMFNNRKRTRCVVYPLHSSLSNEEQQAVFSRPPDGVTKIIISTNIAETSVTIDDVVYVVDSGKMKEKSYDASKSMESLEETWVSRANALQRRGRAGRVASGVCFHLFTSHCFQHHLAEQQLPEIQRVPLEQLCLRIKILDVFAERTLESVFCRLIEPPATGSLDAAKQRLQDLGALTADEKLTPLGYHLACLPVDVRIGKLMLFGAIFRCLDPALTIAASLAFKSPFVSPWDKREEANEKKLNFALANSDHLALLQAYKGWCKAARNGNQTGYQYCREGRGMRNFLSSRGLQVGRPYDSHLSDSILSQCIANSDLSL
uniref:Putative ATP-dependent RNA helicase DHX57 n=1 Tax=Esox lucius TaxID=8010 RepID=A0A3P8ZFT8_ESOLU